MRLMLREVIDNSLNCLIANLQMNGASQAKLHQRTKAGYINLFVLYFSFI